MAKTAPTTIEKLQQEAMSEYVEEQPLTLANLADAYVMFEAMLKMPHANAAKIGQKAGINPVAIGDLKNRKLTKISEAMFLKLKKLHDDLRGGHVAFEETKRGRKAGAVAAPRANRPAPARKPRKAKSTTLPAIFGNVPLVTKEIIAEKEKQAKALALEIEYLKEMKKLQEKFIGRA